jgi:hypothetical protein
MFLTRKAEIYSDYLGINILKGTFKIFDRNFFKNEKIKQNNENEYWYKKNVYLSHIEIFAEKAISTFYYLV